MSNLDQPDSGPDSQPDSGEGPSGTGDPIQDEILELERELCRLTEVTAARIVTDRVGRPIEVHILAQGAKHPKQVVRDIQSVALASFGIELDRRIVSVVQLGGESGNNSMGEVTSVSPEALEIPVRLSDRTTLRHVAAEANGLRSLVRVTLVNQDREAIGFAEGSVASSARHRLVGAATIDALRQLLPAAECCDIDTAQILRVGTEDVAVVTVAFVLASAEHLLSGSAVVRRHDEAAAIARAVLDATNRRLAIVL